MTLRRPEGGLTVLEWCRKDLGPKSLLVGILTLSGLYYHQTTRITIVEAARPETDRQFAAVTQRLDAQRDSIKAKVDTERYNEDQRRLSDQFQAIQLSLATIQQVLMEQPRRKVDDALDPAAPRNASPRRVLAVQRVRRRNA